MKRKLCSEFACAYITAIPYVIIFIRTYAGVPRTQQGIRKGLRQGLRWRFRSLGLLRHTT